MEEQLKDLIAKLEAKDAASEKEMSEKAAELKSLNEKLADLESKAAQANEKVEALEAKASAPYVIADLKSDGDKAQAQYKDAFYGYVRKGSAEAEHELRTKATDLQITTDASGGFALPEELRREIIRLERESSPLRQVASVTTAGTTDVKQLVSTGNAASGWVGETDARTQTNTPDLAQRTATFGEVYARPRAYQHVIEDAFFDVEAWLMEEVTRQFNEVEGVAFLSGDGVNKPVGILNGLTLGASAAVNDTTGAYQVIDSGVNNALGATDTGIIDFLRSVVLATKTGYLSGASWMMNRNTHDALTKLQDANGQYYIQPDITEAAATRLFGYSIVINEDMDNVDEAAASAPILFGDFSRAFQIIDRVGMSLLRDPYTNPGSVMFYTRKRVGSMVRDASALKVVSVAHV